MILAMSSFFLCVGVMTFLGFHDKAKYRAAHPEEFPEYFAKKKARESQL